ncbi:MAG: YihY/virulence factor BrkB family protein [Chlamydiales bacterium]
MKWKKNFCINVWKFPHDKRRPIRSFFLRKMKYGYLFIEAFCKKECYLKASLLTFYSLIALVPLLAIIFAVAEGLGVEAFLQKQILSTFHEQQDVLSIALDFARTLMTHIKSQTIFGIGAVVLFVSVFSLFENIEKCLNAIWGIQKARSLTRRAINYLTALVVVPIAFIFSMSMTIFVNEEMLKIFQAHEMLQQISNYFVALMKFVPYALMCVLFTCIYIFTPNAKIHVKQRLFAGVFAGVVFQLWQLLYIYFQVSISNYNAIYGSFAALPLFVVWMQINFVIFLFGATIAAQLENLQFLLKKPREQRYREISQKQLALLVLRKITSHFLTGEKPIDIEEIASHLGASLIDTREILNVLEKSGIVTEMWAGRAQEKYQLVVNPEIFTVTAIGDLVEKNLIKPTLSKETHDLHIIIKRLQDFENVLNRSGVNCTLKDLASLH